MCIIRIITYGAETWTPTKAELNSLQEIMDNALKIMLRSPITTPTEIILAETGTWDIENQMVNKQLIYYHKIKTLTDKGCQIYKTATDPKTHRK